MAEKFDDNELLSSFVGEEEEKTQKIIGVSRVALNIFVVSNLISVTCYFTVMSSTLSRDDRFIWSEKAQFMIG